MSEQSKSNFQAFGAGLLGFVAVMAVGGGALLVHSSQRAKANAKPTAAAAPIDLGSSMPRPSLSPASAQKERRGESPAPLMGEEEEGTETAAGESAAAGAAVSAAATGSSSSPESAPGAKSTASGLEVTRHLDAAAGNTSAKAVVKNTLAAEKEAKLAKTASKKAQVSPKLEPAAGANAIASIHYGATSRNELMGRAAGPVYNVKGGSAKPASGGVGKMAGDAKSKMADLQRQLANTGLPAEQRAKLIKDLDEVSNGISAAGKTTEAAQ